MERQRKERRLRRPEQAMYIVPGRRSLHRKEASQSDRGHGVTPNDVLEMINSKGDDISGDRVVEILTFFSELGDAQKEKLEGMADTMIKFFAFLVEHQISSPSIMEKLAVTLNLVGRRLEQNFSQELDSLLAIMRDKFIEDNTSPEARGYIWSVIESRAKKWNMTTRQV